MPPAGGVISELDISGLKENGVREVFGPDTPMKEVIEFIKQATGAVHNF